MRPADPYVHLPKPKSEVCHVIGLGPSLSAFRPDGNLTIGCNDCFRKVPTDILIVISFLPPERAQIVTNSRPEKLLSYMPEWTRHPCYQYIGLMNPWNQTRKNVMTKKQLYHSNNTPFVACSLAFNMGFKKIVLWGVDFIDHPLLKDEALERTWTDFSQLQAAFLENGASMYLGSSGSILNLPHYSGFTTTHIAG